MAKSTPELIDALRETAHRLAEGAHYEWGHMGRCNCGHLVQTITDMSDREIVESVDFALNEWSEHARDYCAGTGHKVDDLFLTLQTVGFDYQDVIHLENLSDERVLQRLRRERGDGHCYLRRNSASDAVQYMLTLADLLEDRQPAASSTRPLSRSFSRSVRQSEGQQSDCVQDVALFVGA